MALLDFFIAQISDCHVTARPDGHPRLGNTREYLRRAVDHVNGLRPRPDAVLITGDLCDPGSAEDYDVFREIVSRLGISTYVIPGNHDVRDLLRQAFPDHQWLRQDVEFLHYVIDEYPLRILALDTVVPGADQGLLCDRRLSWIASRLAEAPDRPTIIFMHHPPTDIGLPYIDCLKCVGGEALGEIVRRHDRVLTVGCGHVHRPAHLNWCGTTVVTSPSTCMQFPLEFAPDAKISPVFDPPACRLYQWRNGRLLTHLSYIANS